MHESHIHSVIKNAKKILALNFIRSNQISLTAIVQSKALYKLQNNHCCISLERKTEKGHGNPRNNSSNHHNTEFKNSSH